MKDLVLGPHHKVVLSERLAALFTLGPEEPDVVLLAVGLAVPHEAGAVLVEEHLALGALQLMLMKIDFGGKK